MTYKETTKRIIISAVLLWGGFSIGYGFRMDYGNALEKVRIMEIKYNKEQAREFAEKQFKEISEESFTIRPLLIGKRLGLEDYLSISN